MKIILNGHSKELDNDASLLQIIEAFCKNINRVIAEVNGDIIKRPAWTETTIRDGDKIELVSFVGGG